MAYICVLYASSEGQTREVAEWIADRLGAAGHRVTVDPIDNRYQFGHCAAIVIGASIHVGPFPAELTRFVTQHRDLLSEKPTAFFSVSLTAAQQDQAARETVVGYHQTLAEGTGWEPGLSASFAGALKFSRYNFVKRMVMQKIAQERGLATDTRTDTEYTDWSAVESFADEVSRLLELPSRARADAL